MARHRSPAPAGRRLRPTRASIQQPINARTVRGTWLLVALPLLLAAFTVGRPQPLPRPALPPTFDGEAAAALADGLAEQYPDRAPGSPSGLGAAQWFRDQLQIYGFTGRTDTFTATIPGRGDVQLHNVVAVAQGASARTIVVMAHRDNDGTGPGAVDNASGTAALIELARAYAPLSGPGGARVRPAHRLVFVSTDGGAYGALGRRALRRAVAVRDRRRRRAQPRCARRPDDATADPGGGPAPFTRFRARPDRCRPHRRGDAAGSRATPAGRSSSSSSRSRSRSTSRASSSPAARRRSRSRRPRIARGRCSGTRRSTRSGSAT